MKQDAVPSDRAVAEKPEAAGGRPRWLEEFDRLPPWAQQMVRGLAGCAGYGGINAEALHYGLTGRENYSAFHVMLDKNWSEAWWDGFLEMHELAQAMTAPWPSPTPAPRESMTPGVVEIFAMGEDCAFDQPCHYGHRVESHAVYCHNESWPGSPRKCRRNREDFRHEDCPGFAPNAGFLEPPLAAPGP